MSDYRPQALSLELDISTELAEIAIDIAECKRLNEEWEELVQISFKFMVTDLAHPCAQLFKAYRAYYAKLQTQMIKLVLTASLLGPLSDAIENPAQFREIIAIKYDLVDQLDSCEKEAHAYAQALDNLGEHVTRFLGDLNHSDPSLDEERQKLESCSERVGKVVQQLNQLEAKRRILQQADDDVNERLEQRLDQVKALILEHEAKIFQGNNQLGWFGYWKEKRMLIESRTDVQQALQRARLVALKQEYVQLERDIANLEKSRFNMITQIGHISSATVTAQLELGQQKEAERQQRLLFEKSQQRSLAASSARRQAGNNNEKIHAFHTEFAQRIIQPTQVGRRLNLVRDFICCLKSNSKLLKDRDTNNKANPVVFMQCADLMLRAPLVAHAFLHGNTKPPIIYNRDYHRCFKRIRQGTLNLADRARHCWEEKRLIHENT